MSTKLKRNSTNFHQQLKHTPLVSSTTVPHYLWFKPPLDDVVEKLGFKCDESDAELQIRMRSGCFGYVGLNFIDFV